MANELKQPSTILSTWFQDDKTGSLEQPQLKRWFKGGKAFDKSLRERFSFTLAEAGRGNLNHWLDSSEGALAFIILLDQFNRNIHRGTTQAFAMDNQALSASMQALTLTYPAQVSCTQRVFFYLPFEHHESHLSQSRSVSLFKQLSEEAPSELSDFAHRMLASSIEHKNIVDQFGRYPHRNRVLNRVSTPEELDWLSSESKRYGQ